MLCAVAEFLVTFGGSYVCASFGENRSRNATVRVRTDGHTPKFKDESKHAVRCSAHEQDDIDRRPFLFLFFHLIFYFPVVTS